MRTSRGRNGHARRLSPLRLEGAGAGPDFHAVVRGIEAP
jgi:hypothetical protein